MSIIKSTNIGKESHFNVNLKSSFRKFYDRCEGTPYAVFVYIEPAREKGKVAMNLSSHLVHLGNQSWDEAWEDMKAYIEKRTQVLKCKTDDIRSTDEGFST